MKSIPFTFIFAILCIMFYVNDIECICPLKDTGCKDDCCSFPKCCKLDRCCLTGSAPELVENIWTLISEDLMTDTIRELKAILIKLANSTVHQGPAIGATLWATELLTGFTDVVPPPSCTYVNLIKRTVQEREGCSKGLRKAMADYGTLSQHGINFTRIDTLYAVECAHRPPIDPHPNLCPMKPKLLRTFLGMDDVPNELKDVIAKLHASNNIADLRVSSSIPAAFSEYSVRMFNLMFSSENYRLGLQYKGCTHRIPKKCCSIRAERLSRVMDKVLGDNRRVIAGIIASLPKEDEDDHGDDES